MENPHDFRKWLSALPFAILSRLLFLGEGAESMTPNAWLFWVIFCVAVFILLIYGYVRENLALVGEALHKGNESKILFPPGTDPPKRVRRMAIYIAPFIVL